MFLLLLIVCVGSLAAPAITSGASLEESLGVAVPTGILALTVGNAWRRRRKECVDAPPKRPGKSLLQAVLVLVIVGAAAAVVGIAPALEKKDIVEIRERTLAEKQGLVEQSGPSGSRQRLAAEEVREEARDDRDRWVEEFYFTLIIPYRESVCWRSGYCCWPSDSGEEKPLLRRGGRTQADFSEICLNRKA